jgi:hypothetical protein
MSRNKFTFYVGGLLALDPQAGDPPLRAIRDCLFYIFVATYSRSRWCNGYRALPLDPRFAGSNPAESGGFLKTIKIRSTSSFGGKVKPSAPFRNKFLWQVKIPLRYDRGTDRQNSASISRRFSQLRY